MQADAEAELCKPDAALFAEQSFAVPAAVAEHWEPREQPGAGRAPAGPQMQPAVLQQEPAAQLRPRTAVAVLPDAPAPQLEARALHKRVSPRLRGSQPERRAQAGAPAQPRALALEQPRERVQPASLPVQRRQVSPQPAARPGAVQAVPRPFLSSA